MNKDPRSKRYKCFRYHADPLPRAFSFGVGEGFIGARDGERARDGGAAAGGEGAAADEAFGGRNTDLKGSEIYILAIGGVVLAFFCDGCPYFAF